MRWLFSFLTVTALLLTACSHQQAKKNDAKVKAGNLCDSCCLKKLAIFVDTLNIDAAKPFKAYFNDKRFSLGNCHLKKFRGNKSLKTSLVLFWLKIDNVYLKHDWHYGYVQDIGGESKAIAELVKEFYFLYTNKDPEWLEFLSPAWVNDIIKGDSSLLANKQIAKIFNENKNLKSRSKQKQPW